MRKAQIISMDFIMTFVVYIFALSVFFFALQNSFVSDSSNLDASAELMFAKIDETYNISYDFLDGAIIQPATLDTFLTDIYTPRSTYDFIFKDFENPGMFTRTDYCVYIENRSSTTTNIIRNFAAYTKADGYTISINGGPLCGADIRFPYVNKTMKCNDSNAEAIVLTKPILYGQDIMSLKVLICGVKR